ncbi:hypothetical protein MVEN_00039000 [Mycena venus]|uniref:Integrase catalytic domain-containing protein n=1 Tax=Mycena venus TaxID=2733690 RepID=A0A8H6Z3B2_9AGAR|nr:hypothetical protein MVEN_00039000 [Mycena venus]
MYSHTHNIAEAPGFNAVPSACKFNAVEEATAAIANIIARDVNQGQGLDTVKKIASLRLNLTIPRDSVRDTMKGLVGQGPSDMRRPGRRKGPKKRSALDAIGVFQEIHVDGHEELGEKALCMGPGIGIDIYGMRDHVGKILWLVSIPNSRLSDTIGHVFLDIVSTYKAISIQVTFDGGSELGWLASFQTTLREVFAPRLNAEEWKPILAVQSSINVPIESIWSCDRLFNNHSIHDSSKAGSIRRFSPQESFPLALAKIVQIGLDEFVDYFNKKTRKQSGRILPSGVAPNVVFDMPEDYGLENLASPVTEAAIDELRRLIDTTQEEAFRWVSDEFDALASRVYEGLGSPRMEALTGWAIFNAMALLIREQVEADEVYDKLVC